MMYLQATVKVLYPEGYLPTSNDPQTSLINNFVTGLESALGIVRTPISLAGLWKEDRPDGEEHDDIAKYLKTVCPEPRTDQGRS